MFNFLIISNRNVLSLIKKILSKFYIVKIYSKFDIIIIFNKIRVKKNYKKNRLFY